MKKILFIAASLLLGLQISLAQDQDAVNRQIFDKVYAAVKDKAELPTGALALEIAKQFLETKYAYYTLEQEPEQLRVYLDRTDCILFVELCSSFAQTVKGRRIVQAGDGVHYAVRETPSVEKAEPSYELLCQNIQNMRYRLGVVDGYGSRLHYTSEWLLQNQTNGIMYELSETLGEPFNQSFFYMTTHKNVYKQLRGDEAQCAAIKAAEERLDIQAPYWFVSQKELMKDVVINQIKDGDIIMFMDSHPGLDIAHVAMACTGEDGKMHFIHAGTGLMKVAIDSRTLAEYATRGLRVARLR